MRQLPILLFLALFLVKRVAFGRVAVITDNDKTTARQQDNDILAQFEVDIQHDDWSHHIGQSKWLKLGSQMCQMFLTDEEKRKNTLDKFKNVHGQIANNCKEYRNVLGDGSVKNVEELRQQLANSILGENGEKADAFLASPFMPIEKNQLAGIHETENDRLAGRRYFTILQQMVARMPATSGLRLAIEQLLKRNERVLQHQNGGGNEKAVKASYLSLTATLDLFQLLWGQFFDEKGMPTPAAEHVLRGGLAPFPIYLTPSFGMAFHYYSWIYLNVAADWEWLEQFTSAQSFPFLGLTLLTYLAILCAMISQRGKMGSISAPQSAAATCAPQQQQQQQQHQQLAPHELRLLLQAVVQFIVEISLCALWAWQMLCGSCAGGNLGLIFTNWFWIFLCGFKPLLYLTINKTIRGRMLLLWRFKIERNAITSAFRIKPPERSKKNNDLQLQQQQNIARNIRTININVSFIHGSSRCDNF